MQLKVDDREDVRKATIGGALDVFSVQMLPAKAFAAMPDRVRSLVIDLRDVSFVDSAGVSALVKVHHEAHRRALDVHARLGDAQHRINETIVELLRRVLPVDD